MCLWTLFCSQGNIHAGTEKGFPLWICSHKKCCHKFVIVLNAFLCRSIITLHCINIFTGTKGSWFVHQTVRCVVYNSIVAVSFTPLQLRLVIVHSDLRFLCFCLSMETYFMKVSMHSCFQRRVDTLQWVMQQRMDDFYVLQTSALGGLTLWDYIVYCSMAELLLVLDTSTAQ